MRPSPPPSVESPAIAPATADSAPVGEVQRALAAQLAAQSELMRKQLTDQQALPAGQLASPEVVAEQRALLHQGQALMEQFRQAQQADQDATRLQLERQRRDELLLGQDQQPLQPQPEVPQPSAALKRKKAARSKQKEQASDSSTSSSSSDDGTPRRSRTPRDRSLSGPSLSPSLLRLGQKLSLRQLSAQFLQAQAGGGASAALVLEAALSGRSAAQCTLPFAVPGDGDAEAAYMERLLARLWDVVDASATSEQLRQLEDGTHVSLLVKVGLFQHVATMAREAPGAGSSTGNVSTPPPSGSGFWPGSRGASFGSGGASSGQLDPESSHLAGKAAVNGVSVQQLIRPGRAERDWAEHSGDGPPPPAPKAAVQFAMADDHSRDELRGEFAPAMWRALQRDRAHRARAARAAAETVLGDAACESAKVKKHLAAFMTGRFTRAAPPKELTSNADVTGAFGLAEAGYDTDAALVLQMNAHIAAAAFPELSWACLEQLSFAMQRMLVLQLPSVTRRAQTLYKTMLRRVERAFDAVRDDVSKGPLLQLQLPGFSEELKEQADGRIEVAQAFEADKRGGGGIRQPLLSGPTGGLGVLAKQFGLAMQMSQASQDTVRTEWRKAFNGKCMYFGIAGECHPRGNQPCTMSHDAPPSKAEIADWTTATKAKL